MSSSKSLKLNIDSEQLIKQNVEVQIRPSKRLFTKAYKARIVAEAAECHTPGSIGALLRRERIGSTTLHRWRQAAALGQLADSRKPGVKKDPDVLSLQQKAKLSKLERENAKLKAMIELQKKIVELFGSENENIEEEPCN